MLGAVPSLTAAQLAGALPDVLSHLFRQEGEAALDEAPDEAEA